MKIERRYLTACELRAEDGESGKLVGYAAVFNREAEIWPGMVEVIRPGAFSDAVGRDDVRALWNHDPNFVLGRSVAGTLDLVEDEIGLRVSITPPDTQWARDLRESIRRRDVSQMSFTFRAVKDRWQSDESGKQTRELLEAELFDVSPVTFPAYAATTIEARSALGLARESEITPELRTRLVRAEIDRLTNLLGDGGSRRAEETRAGVPLDLLRLQLDLIEHV